MKTKYNIPVNEVNLLNRKGELEQFALVFLYDFTRVNCEQGKPGFS